MTHLEAYLAAIGAILFVGVILADRRLERLEREQRKANVYLRQIAMLAHYAHERAEGRFGRDLVWWTDPAEHI